MKAITLHGPGDVRVESVPDPRIGFPAREAFFKDFTLSRSPTRRKGTQFSAGKKTAQ